ncbi:MAG TPA: amidohydrolase family protein [Thermoleophilia bacterium]|nr:amidohydrolase family protein [Thermoleophilia bacterium]
MLLEADWVVPMSGPPIPRGGVVVLGGKIAEVGPAVQLRARWGGEEVRAFPDCVLMPGLINAHSHLDYSAFHSFSLPCGFGEWMLRLLMARRKLAVDDYAVSARWGARECARAGMTCIADTSFEGWTSARAAGEAGLRARVHLEVIGLDDADLPETMGRTEDRLAILRRACGPLVEPGLSPHAPYTVSARLYRELARFARREGLRLATHVAESKAEVDLLEKGTGALVQAYETARLWQGQRWTPPGLRPVSFLDQSEALGPDMLAVHCVQVDAEDVALLARSGARVAHCPRSNRRLQCDTAPVAQLRAAGVVTGLGTDSLASNESLDLFAEMRAAVEMSEARAAPPVLDETAALRMATLEGAAALGLDHLVGSLETGKEADLIAVRLPRPVVAGADLPVLLVKMATPSHVRMTMVAGTVVIDKDGPSSADDALDRAFAAVRRKLDL